MALHNIMTDTGQLAQPVAQYEWAGTGWKPRIGGPAASDAFGRMRIAAPETVFEGKSLFDGQPLLFDDAEVDGTGTGSTFGTATVDVTLSVGTAIGTRARQSKRRPAYQPGKSQLGFVTFTFGAAAAGITRRTGLFDANDGIFLEQAGTASVNIVVRSSTSGSAVATSVAQADWSDDTFSELNLSKAQILVLDYEWLGVGSVRVGFVIDGFIRYAHTFQNANSVTGVYMANPNLPVRWEIANDGTGAISTLKAICASIISEGGAQTTGFKRTVDRGIAELTTSSDTNIYPLVALRLKSTALNATVRLSDLSIFCNSTADYRFAVLLNPTIGGTALSFAAVADSAVEADVASSSATTASAGTLLYSGYGSSTNQAQIASAGSTDYALGSKIDGTSDIIVLAVQNLAAGAEKYWASLSWVEQV